MSNKMAAIVKVFDSPTVKERFDRMLGVGAGLFIADVLAEVRSNPELVDCDVTSIYLAAIKAATLRMPKGDGNWYLIPFKTGERKICTFVIGYRGLYQAAMRTGMYRYLNAFPLFPGQAVEYSPETAIPIWSGVPTTRKIEERIGWYAHLVLMNGFQQAVYMTVDEIHDHARRYSKIYPGGVWKSETYKMERKTILRKLLREWGVFEPSVERIVSTDEGIEIPGRVEITPGISVDEAVNAAETDIIENPPPRRSPDEILKELGF